MRPFLCIGWAGGECGAEERDEKMNNDMNVLLRDGAEPALACVGKLSRLALFTLAVCFSLSSTLFASTSVLIAEENFEGIMSCKLSSVGSFPVAPGIKSGMGVGESSAYGFGRSTCRYDAWDGYVNDLIFTFPKKCVITKVKFWEIERYDNWGSQGWLIANGVKINDTTFGRLPSNDRVADSSFREKEFDINVVSTSLTFRCWDITDCSELFIDNIRIYGYVYEDAFTVAYNANGGAGNMIPLQGFSVDKPQRLYKNVYHKDGYVFQGWASNSVERANAGIVDYKDEALITVDSDMTLYAVWDNPPLTLAAESADWLSGSITLRCEDSDTSGTAHEYTLEYKNASGAWEEVDGAKNKLATKGQDANGREAWVVQLTDNTFWSRLGGIPPVEYRVKDESGRVSGTSETRNRHALFVAIDKYKDETKNLSQPTHEAAVFRGTYKKYAGVNRYLCTLIDVEAKKDTIINQLDNIAKNYAKPGDIVLFYHVGHGLYGGLCCHDKDRILWAHELSEKFQDFPAGVGVVAVVYACFSGSMIDRKSVV